MSSFRDPAFTANRDLPVHRWVPWIAGFSKHFIEDAIKSYTDRENVVCPAKLKDLGVSDGNHGCETEKLIVAQPITVFIGEI